MNELPARPNYFPRQFLRTQDLTAAQAYHLALHRRHNIAHHIWGIVRGLELVADEDGFYVLPGIAVDGFGRDLVLAERVSIPKQALDQRNTDELEVWLTYDRVGSDPAPAGYTSCDTDPSQAPPYRWIERPQLRYSVPDPSFGDRRKPRGLTEAELRFDATLRAPDSPEQEWLLYLGLARRTAGPRPEYSVDPSGRPYAGLQGESVMAPSGEAWLQVGLDPWELQGEDRVTRRFGVYLPPTGQDKAPRVPLSIDSQGDTALRGNATVYGEIRVDSGALAFDGLTDRQTPQPWRVYRYRVPEGQPSPGDELRIEMASGGQGLNQVTIGSWSADENRFIPCLTVDDQCFVRVHGDLHVEGQLLRDGQPITSLGNVRLDQEATTLNLMSFHSGLAGTHALLAAAFGATPQPAPVFDEAASTASAATAAARSVPTEIEQVGDGIAAIPDKLGDLADYIEKHYGPGTVDKVRSAFERKTP